MEEERDRCTAKVLEPRLLDLETTADAALESVLRLRGAEVDEARTRVRGLLSLIRAAARLVDDDEEAQEALNDYPCLLIGLYEQVESTDEIPEPCGRCLACRRMSASAPSSVVHQGGRARWATPVAPPTALRGPLLVFTRDDEHVALEELVEKLAHVGVSQFVLPATLTARASQVLSTRAGHVGLVVELEEVVAGRWLALPVSTAVWMDASLGDRQRTRAYEAVRQQVLSRPEVGLIFVAPHDMMVAGKRLSSIASPHTPLRHDRLAEQIGGPR